MADPAAALLAAFVGSASIGHGLAVTSPLRINGALCPGRLLTRFLLLFPPQFIPMPVLYGVFLYMGVASLNGVQVSPAPPPAPLQKAAIVNQRRGSFAPLPSPFSSPTSLPCPRNPGGVKAACRRWRRLPVPG